MNHIYIEHNPFIIETIFRVNDIEPSSSSSLVKYANQRLQLWVENIFTELQSQFNGATEFSVEFKGLESDFNDIEQAAKKARKEGMEIQLKWDEVESAQSRLDKIKQMMERVKNTPKFAEYLKSSGKDVQNVFDEALNNDFDVYVVATMSSGKSTFVNAMLGQDLLPAANQATTATIAQIFDDKNQGKRFRGERYGKCQGLVESVEQVTLEQLTEWNTQPDTEVIKLYGDILAVESNDNVRLVLTDTPGPNNSQNEEHARTTMGFIQDSQRNPLILYVLNGTQLSTKDDCNLLRLVAEIMKKGGKQSKDRFLFVLNKMDAFDPEKGESIESALNAAKNYLCDNGIEEPNIYPVSARMAYLLRKQGQGEELTRNERHDKNGIEDLLLEEPSMAFPQYMYLSKNALSMMERKSKHSRALRNSGVPAVEAVIDEYINKYSFPMRLNRAHLALTKTIEQGLKEEQLIAQLDIDKKELVKLATEIEHLKERRKQGFNTENYKEDIRRSGKDLPQTVQDKLIAMEQAILSKITETGGVFSGKLNPSSAKNIINTAVADIEFSFKKVINEYEQAFQQSQEIIKEDLRQEYAEHIKSLFPESNSLELPVFKSLKESIGSISLDISLNQDDIKTRKKVVGSKKVSDSRWYNPFSWGRTKSVSVYGDVEYVDLQEVWKERVVIIRSNFNTLKDTAIKRIKEDKNKLILSYLSSLESEFEPKFEALLNSLEKKVLNQGERMKAVEQAKQDLIQINQLKEELESILSL